TLSFTLNRARFSVPLETDTMIDGNIGRIEVPQLVGAVADEVSNAVKRLDANGAGALVLDLRGDPGGDLSAAVDIASIFVRQGTPVYQTGRAGNRTPLDVNRCVYIDSTRPLVLLVDKNSASGAEIIAAGIRANGAGLVMGTQTAGCVGTGQPRDHPKAGGHDRVHAGAGRRERGVTGFDPAREEAVGERVQDPDRRAEREGDARTKIAEVDAARGHERPDEDEAGRAQEQHHRDP